MGRSKRARAARRWSALVALALAVWAVAGPPAAVAEGPSPPRAVAGQVFSGGLDAAERAALAVPRRLDPARPAGVRRVLKPFIDRMRLADSEPEPGLGAPLRIGSHRRLPTGFQAEMGAGDLEWEAGRDGGRVATLSVTSPGAEALRLALAVRELPPGSQVRFYSPSAPAAAGGVFGPARLRPPRRSSEGEPFWSPVVEGETAVVEIWVPEREASSEVLLSVRGVSHLYRSVTPRDLRHLGNAGACNRDLACFGKWKTAGRAVAKIAIEKDGGTVLCTGQLLANRRGWPLLLTAAHCIGRRSEADSASFFWFFERAACNGDDPTTVTQTGGGGRLLFTSRSNRDGLVTDHTLIKLRAEPPAGVTMLAWEVGEDPEDDLRRRVHSVHHPGADVKKASRGKVTDLWQLRPDRILVDSEPATHYEVVWRRGTTEAGSSGAALLAGNRWPDQYVLGVLTGGFASCATPREPDFYGMLAETYRRYPKFRRRLE